MRFPRRHFLQAAGISLALPWLDAFSRARASADLETAAVEDSETGRVVPAVFETLETLDQKWRSVLLTHITDDPAHGPIPSGGPGRDGLAA